MKLFAKATVLVLLLAACLVSVPAMAGAAGPSCRGASCDGRDPAKTNCTEGALTLMSRHARTGTGEDVGLLELRYSPKCYSNWVRFTPWYGVRSWLANQAAGATAYGKPWIWRFGVPHSLRGYAGQSSIASIGSQTVWSQMVTAKGTTCSSVSLYQTSMKRSGQISYDRLGDYNAPCIS